MRLEEFYVDGDGPPGPWGRASRATINSALIEQIRRGPLPDRGDAEVAPPLARLIHDELQKYGTGGGNEMSDGEMREAIRALHAVVGRLGIPSFEVPFRDFSGFRSYWLRNDGYGSWQARRDLLERIFEPVHEQLIILEDASIASSLAMPISPHQRTGWAAVDEELTELRRHFQNAKTPQDYRNVGLDCVAVTEALSRHVYDPAKHLRSGETEPPVANTKQRLDRFVEDSAPGPDNVAVRRMAKTAIELAQAVKHAATPTRREAGIAADEVIQLANILRRLDEPQ